MTTHHDYVLFFVTSGVVDRSFNSVITGFGIMQPVMLAFVNNNGVVTFNNCYLNNIVVCCSPCYCQVITNDYGDYGSTSSFQW